MQRGFLLALALTAPLAFSFGLGCAKQPEGGGAQAPAGAAPEKKPEGQPSATLEIPWEKKTHEQRMEYMSQVVYPKMKQLFQEHDPKNYAKFKCQTCHGEDMEAVNFKMPNSLYALPKEKTIDAAMEYDADTTKFMMEKVLPTMTDLLGMQAFDPKTGQGFSCFNCHQTEK